MANTVQLPGTQLGLDENVRIGPGLKRNHYDGSIHVTEVRTFSLNQGRESTISSFLVWSRSGAEQPGMDGGCSKTLHSRQGRLGPWSCHAQTSRLRPGRY